MHFTDIVALSLPILGALAAPVADCTTPAATATSTSSPPQSTGGPTGPFNLISTRSGSKVHLLPWTASGSRFYLGGNSSTYCPQVVGNSCPDNNSTLAFASACGLDTTVPGGQQVYIASDGSLGYTQAHSASVPKGGIQCPFVYQNNGPNSFGGVTLNPRRAYGATSFMACPVDDGRYQVFAALNNATVPQNNVTACLSFNALAFNYTGSPAWQYT